MIQLWEWNSEGFIRTQDTCEIVHLLHAIHRFHPRWYPSGWTSSYWNSSIHHTNRAEDHPCPSCGFSQLLVDTTPSKKNMASHIPRMSRMLLPGIRDLDLLPVSNFPAEGNSRQFPPNIIESMPQTLEHPQTYPKRTPNVPLVSYWIYTVDLQSSFSSAAIFVRNRSWHSKLQPGGRCTSSRVPHLALPVQCSSPFWDGACTTSCLKRRAPTA